MKREMNDLFQMNDLFDSAESNKSPMEENSNVREQIEQLRMQLHQHNYNYYVLNSPSISDKAFDEMMRKLQDLEKEHPDVSVWAAAEDDRLNEVKYIVPGIGDAGDRLFGTL